VPTSVDIAREAGVSQATVSRVLNRDPRVAPDTRARVLAVMERLDYTPNAIARGLVTSRTKLVGVVVSDVMNPFYPQLLEAIAERLGDRDLKMVLFNAGLEREDAYTRVLLEQRVDGMIFTAAARDSPTVRHLAERGVPFVLTNRRSDGVTCDTATGDNVGGARLVARHLLELGHERIAVIAGHPRASTSHERLEGIQAALAEAGRPLAGDLVRQGNFSAAEARGLTVELLGGADPPTAIFCLNDLMAFGALNGARHAGARVPEDVSIVGFDDVWMAGWETFELTTVHQPLAEMARASVDLLVERLERPRRPVRTLIFPTRLVVRATTAPARP
jgi:LacI family transcriptional regulator